MARWSLRSAHYLPVADNQWQYEETDRTTGKRARQTFNVPAYMDPKDSSDCNYPGEIIVCHEGKGQGKDITFFGEPTPEMEPIDDEAKAITNSLKHKWVHPIENDQLYSQSMLSDLQRQVATIAAGQSVAKPATISAEEFAALQAQVKALMEQNAKLTAGRRA